jgi:hypothetical protein
VSEAQYDVFEQMHYVCFHYEFEHGQTDVDAECAAGGCPSRRGTLRETLRDWTDADVAAFQLGRAVGLYDGYDEFTKVKGTFWTDNALGNGLHAALMALAAATVLEHRDEPDVQFRWSKRALGSPRV